MSVPRFSLIVTSYNQRQFIKDAIDSATALRTPTREIIVVDDGSTDGSQAVLREYGDAIELVPLSINRGKGGARNCGAAIARGDYLVFLDGDDVFLPWALDVYERIAEAKSPELILVPMLWFEGPVPTASPSDGPGSIRFVEYDDYLRKDRAFGVSASSVIIRREAFEKVSGWGNLPVMQDQELMIRLGTVGRTIHVLSPPTIGHRKHAGQTVWTVPPYLDAMVELIRKERSGGFPGGRARRLERVALLGALAFFWSKRAFKARLYWSAVKLFAGTWPMQLWASVRRLHVIMTGRRPPEELMLDRGSCDALPMVDLR